MSIKSLLQIILLLLIISILGSIYFFYFYSKPDNQTIKLDEITQKNLTSMEAAVDAEKPNFESREIILSSDNEKSSNETRNEDAIKNKNTISEENNAEKKFDLEKIKNLTTEIEYITSNKNGDVFKISAKYGKTNFKNTNILDLENVSGVISSKERSKIYISSNYAKYNYNNQNSKFYGNVILKYDNKIITCNNLDLIISDNIAVAYTNVMIKDDKSKMTAQMITLDTVTKDININAQEKIKIISN